MSFCSSGPLPSPLHCSSDQHPCPAQTQRHKSPLNMRNVFSISGAKTTLKCLGIPMTISKTLLTRDSPFLLGHRWVRARSRNTYNTQSCGPGPEVLSCPLSAPEGPCVLCCAVLHTCHGAGWCLCPHPFFPRPPPSSPRPPPLPRFGLSAL